MCTNDCEFISNADELGADYFSIILGHCLHVLMGDKVCL